MRGRTKKIIIICGFSLFILLFGSVTLYFLCSIETNESNTTESMKSDVELVDEGYLITITSVGDFSGDHLSFSSNTSNTESLPLDYLRWTIYRYDYYYRGNFTGSPVLSYTDINVNEILDVGDTILLRLDHTYSGAIFILKTPDAEFPTILRVELP